MAETERKVVKILWSKIAKLFEMVVLFWVYYKFKYGVQVLNTYHKFYCCFNYFFVLSIKSNYNYSIFIWLDVFPTFIIYLLSYIESKFQIFIYGMIYFSINIDKNTYYTYNFGPVPCRLLFKCPNSYIVELYRTLNTEILNNEFKYVFFNNNLFI